jgi:hypothetical protein
MLFNSIIVLLLIITILLLMQRSKIFIFGLILILFIVLTKNTYENYASMDIYYQNENNQTLNKDNMLNIFKNTKNNYYNIYKTVSDKSNDNCNIYDNYIINESYSYILVKEIDSKYYTLNGFIYDINNSDVYIEEVTENNLKNSQNYGLKLLSNKIDNTSKGFSIYLQPKNNKYTSSIPVTIQGMNNGSVKVDPMLGNTNSIFYINSCSDYTTTDDFPSILNVSLEKAYECVLQCNNELYLNNSSFENTIKNKKKVILNSDKESRWLLLIYDKKNMDELYNNFE